MPEQPKLFDLPEEPQQPKLFEIPEQPQQAQNPNPCVALFGSDPQGRKCKGCVHLYRAHGGAHTFLKCDLRRYTRGPGSDHRASWDGCGRYEEREEHGE